MVELQVTINKELENRINELETLQKANQLDQTTVSELMQYYHETNQTAKLFKIMERHIGEFGKESTEEQVGMFLKIMIQSIAKVKNFDVYLPSIAQIMEIALQKQWQEVVSLIFIIKGYSRLVKNELQLALQEAKLAYFYVQKIKIGEEQFARCNAQLLIAFVLIHKNDLDGVHDFIQSVKWTKEACKSDEELVFVKCISIMMDLLKRDETVVNRYVAMYDVLKKSENSYSVLLMEQMQKIIEKFKQHIHPSDYVKIMECYHSNK